MEKKRVRGGRASCGSLIDSRESSSGNANTARCPSPRTADVCETASVRDRVRVRVRVRVRARVRVRVRVSEVCEMA